MARITADNIRRVMAGQLALYVLNVGLRREPERPKG